MNDNLENCNVFSDKPTPTLYGDDAIRFLNIIKENEKLFKNKQNMKNRENIIEWARQKGILEKSTPLKQHEKTQEEVDELKEALELNDKHLIEDSIGDIMVTLIIQAELNDLDIEDCLQSAYNVIKMRTGKMVNGLFVKDK